MKGGGLGAHVTLVRSAEREWKAYSVIPSGKDHWGRGQHWRLSFSFNSAPRHNFDKKWTSCVTPVHILSPSFRTVA